MGGSFFAPGIPVNKTLKRRLKRWFKSKKENEKSRISTDTGGHPCEISSKTRLLPKVGFSQF